MGESKLLKRGDPQAPGMVLVHGTRMAGAYWQAQVEVLSDAY